MQLAALSFTRESGGRGIRRTLDARDSSPLVGAERMHEQFANGFYSSTAWRKCREAFRQYRGGLCERCMKRGLITPGTEVHHKVRLTPENIHDPAVTLSWDNLELLCKACHDDEHGHAEMRTDERGHVAL